MPVAGFVRHLIGQGLGVFLCLILPAGDAGHDQSGLAVPADQTPTQRRWRGPRRGHVRDVRRALQLIDDAQTHRAGRTAADSPGAVTVISICTSPWPNLSVSSCVALEDSEVGSGIRWRTGCWPPGCRRCPAAATTTAAADDSPRRFDGQMCDSSQHVASSPVPADARSAATYLRRIPITTNRNPAGFIRRRPRGPGTRRSLSAK